MSGHDFLRNAIVYLSAAVLTVTLTKRLGLGSILGYLVAGMAIGPSGLGLIRSAEEVLGFAEFGVVILLFLIGLELNPRRLWEMRKPIFGMGGLQVLATIAFVTPVLALIFSGWSAGLVAAMGAAMSSTALALQLMRERGLHQTAVGEASFSVLLFQDLAVIPMLSLLPLLAVRSGATETFSFIPVLKGVAAILTVVLLGRYLIRPVFRFIAAVNLREIFTAFSLFLIFGVAYLMHEVGLSMALGAFLAGVLLAESEYRHELEIDLEPFKGLLLGLFFIAVGMTIDLGMFQHSALKILAVVATILVLKLVVLTGIARAFSYSRQEAVLFGITLSQGGEFAFVLYGVAAQGGLIDSAQAGVLNIAIALSMASTPFLMIAFERLIQPRLGPHSPDREYSVTSDGNPVILAGYGRIGQVVGRLLHAQRIGVTILEQDPTQIEVVSRFGWKAFYGDVSRLDLLENAGAKTAKLLILAIDDTDAIWRTLKLVDEHFPHLKVIVRAESRLEAYRFHNQNVPSVRSTFAPGLELAEESLKLLGYPGYEAHFIANRFRRYDRDAFIRSAALIDDERAIISFSHESREELAKIMRTDDLRRSEAASDGWG